MRITICAVGRMKRGPEAELFADYSERFDRIGRGIGLGPVRLLEVDDRKGGGMEGEADLLRKAMPEGAVICALDERGVVEPSPAFAKRLTQWRDSGRSEIAFLIGGADGLASGLRQQADHLLSFGKMVWPHMLVRVMLAEQLYRAASIETRSPYHRA